MFTLALKMLVIPSLVLSVVQQYELVGKWVSSTTMKDICLVSIFVLSLFTNAMRDF
jgi:hypothetical protein